MDADQLEQRLSSITTQWSMVFKAHDPDKSVGTVRSELLLRYSGAVYRYLLAVVRDAELAEELCQQFAVKLLDGELHGADPGRGRFRDYVKTVVINLVRYHYKSRAKAPTALPDGLADDAGLEGLESEDEFAHEWREEVMNQTWKSLAKERPVYHDLLRLRVAHPDLTSRQLGERYTEEQGKPMKSDNVRKTLERAHAKFADLLVREVASSLDQADPEQLRTELEELDLLKYCRSALERWTAAS